MSDIPHASADSTTHGKPVKRAHLAHRLMRLSARLRMAEPEVLGLGTIVREGDDVFDIGAAYGMYTLPLADLVGASGRVHAFEPQRRQADILMSLRRLIGASQLTVTKSVVGPESGNPTLVLPYRFGMPIYGHAHVAPEHGASRQPPIGHTKRFRTPMHTVDSWRRENGIGAVSFMKVDVEGFEPSVLAGARDTIEEWRPSMLLEIEDRHLARYGRSGDQFADEVRTTWPDYRMYTWRKGLWKLTDHVRVGIRNYLFATEAALARGQAMAP